MRCIVFTRPDGGVSIVIPASNFVAQFPTEAEALAVVRAKSVPADALDIGEIEDTDLPTDREFRDAWRLNAGVARPDLPAARDIQAARIDAAKRWEARALLEREPLGENVTGEMIQLAAIDARALVDAAQDIAALKAAFPPGLPRRP